MKAKIFRGRFYWTLKVGTKYEWYDSFQGAVSAMQQEIRDFHQAATKALQLSPSWLLLDKASKAKRIKSILKFAKESA